MKKPGNLAAGGYNFPDTENKGYINSMNMIWKGTGAKWGKKQKKGKEKEEK